MPNKTNPKIQDLTTVNLKSEPDGKTEFHSSYFKTGQYENTHSY